MYGTRRSARGLRGLAIALLACLGPLAAWSQPKPASSEVAVLEEVVVTGSRLATLATETVSPVVAVSSDQFQQMGVTNVEDLLNTLPQLTASQSSGLSQGSTGAATLSLRDLGSNRTMVLINGRRLMPGDPTLYGLASPDVNNIPPELIKRVEVLTGGASSTYGADAVAGVVNFIMDDQFRGVRLVGDYGTYYHKEKEGWINNALAQDGFAAAPSGTGTDGGKKSATLLLGGDFMDGAGGVTTYLSYTKSEPVQGNARDYNNCTLGASASGFTCRGSANTYPAAISGNDGNLYQLAADGSSFVPLYSLFNYGPDHYFQRDDVRYNAGVFANLKLNDRAEAYTEFMFMRDDTTAQYAPTAIFFGSGHALDPQLGVPDGNYYVNCGTGFGSPGANPFLNQTLYSQLCTPGSVLVSSQGQFNGNTLSQVTLAMRNAVGGDRRDEYEHTAFRAVMGLRGDLGAAWKYDAYFMDGVTLYDTTHFNDFSAQRVAAALQVVNNPATGQLTCLGDIGQNSAPGCVPFNIWQPGGVTPAALAYLQVPSYQSGRTEEQVLNANVSGDLGSYGIKLPAAKDGLKVNFGVEGRRERLILNVDQAYIDGDVSGSGILEPVDGGFSVRELFAEGRLPLVEDLPFAKSVGVDFGYRYSDYTTGKKTTTYKFGVEYAPTSDLRLRGSLQRAVRAPNVQELYQPAHVALDGGNDYCANGNVPFYTLAQCMNTGVTAGQYGAIVGNPAAQYNGLLGGNANLNPETAVTKSFGLVITPSAVPALTATIDYYDIKITDLITALGGDFVLNECAQTGLSQWCSLVHRAGNGSLWLSPAGYVQDLNVNAGGQRASGIDFAVAYRMNLGGAGMLRADFNGGYVSRFEFDPFGASSFDCAGLFGIICVQPLPKWKHTLGLTWTPPRGAFDLNLEWRYVGSVKLETTDPSLPDYDPASSPSYADLRLSPQSYIDIGASYHIANWTLRLGINNLFDRDPPIVGAGEGGNSVFYENNTFPGIYDTLGRQLHFSVRADF
jgi:iron complex outermembrane recepter protein